jgi:hypothetical protein
MTKAVTRRRFLRGAGGTAIALPYLLERRAHAAGPVPKRLVFFYVCEGVQANDFSFAEFQNGPQVKLQGQFWWPKNSANPALAPAHGSTDYSLADSTLAGFTDPTKGLRDWKNKLTFVRGVHYYSGKADQVAHKMRGESGCLHGVIMPHLMTGGVASKAQSVMNPATNQPLDVPAGISVDRVIGRAIQGSSPFATYEVSVRGDSKISYDRQAAPRSPVSSPYTVFNKLLGGGAPTGADVNSELQRLHDRRKSVLDFVLGDLATLKARVGADNLQRVDAHLTAIRSVESTIDELYNRRGTLPPINTTEVMQTGDSNYLNAIANVPKIAQLQMDLARIALSADLVRVMTVELGATVSGWTFPFLDVTYKNATHHNQLSHMEGALEKIAGARIEDVLADRRKIYTWFSNQYLYMASKMNELMEPNGNSLLDNSAVIYLSEFSWGQDHNPNNIPFVIAGGLQRTFRPGYFDLNTKYNYAYSAPNPKDDRPVATGRSNNDLWLTLCRSFGLGLPSFGFEGFSGDSITDILA